MKISVKCFATLARFTPDNPEEYEAPDGADVGQVVDILGLDREQVTIIFVNGTKASMDSVLSQGDRLGLFPAVGGG